MIKKPISSFQYILEEEEMTMIVKCLNYCKHRLTKHQNKGIHKILSNQEVGAMCDLIDEVEFKEF